LKNLTKCGGVHGADNICLSQYLTNPLLLHKAEQLSQTACCTNFHYFGLKFMNKDKDKDNLTYGTYWDENEREKIMIVDFACLTIKKMWI
jgi:hypothetical protein